MQYRTLLVPLGLVLPVLAQTPPVTVTTATDFGVLATANSQSSFHSVAVNTALPPAFFVGARVGGGNGPGPMSRLAAAEAHTSVVLLTGPRPGNQPGLGVHIEEAGMAVGLTATDAALSGSSADAPTATAPTRAAHGLTVAFAAAANATGTVVLNWRGDATANASATVDVDVDGDNVIDFHGVANGTPVQQQFPVTAGANGVVVSVTTTAAADVQGVGNEHYRAGLSVHFAGTVTQPTVTFTPFGPSCDGTLSGQMVPTPRGNAVQLDVRGATAGSLAFLVVGAPLATPLNLPGSQCQLLVQPGFHGFTLLDANGDGSRVLGVPGRPPITVDFQMLTLDLSGSTLALGTTNGLNLQIQ